ncbi:ComF family protein [Polynucleobacter sp. MWH-UH2A]|uniref:ComF family protein n=1 Tax=Polynucleobacter sp. MWH-UH2A TaxID=1855617 RepID=UPI001BFCE61D|nr:phosphoribosyltransferase family protein [Polynucleobacter sp. MWH-UH2A]QWD63957.1 ComF family protein [Polynucleobacter sp. MWH-UH2A]
MRFLENLIQSISAQVLPTACIICQEFQSASICSHCLPMLYHESLLHYECCYQCGIPLQAAELHSIQCHACSTQVPAFDQTICLDRYDGLLQAALHQFKYQKRLAYAFGLSDAWNSILANDIDDQSIDYLLPVPLSQKKLLARGFNQSWEIAKRIRCGSHIQKLPSTLKRFHDIEHQAGKNFSERKHDIRQMFYVDAKDIESLKGKSVVIFDDVMTSGATLNEIARTLKIIGVVWVSNWVLLRTTKLNP